MQADIITRADLERANASLLCEIERLNLSMNALRAEIDRRFNAAAYELTRVGACQHKVEMLQCSIDILRTDIMAPRIMVLVALAGLALSWVVAEVLTKLLG